MSVNRFEITMPMICAAPDVLLPQIGACGAATVILDIRTDWLIGQPPVAVQTIVTERQSQAGATLFRVGNPGDAAGLTAIERLVTLRPHSFVLSGCGGVADIQKFDVMLRVAEASQGIEPGSIGLAAELGGNAALLLPQASLKDVSKRLHALVLDSEGVTEATASQAFNTVASRTGAPLLMARAAAVIMARHAGLACYDLLRPMDDAPQTVRDIALADGFSGVIACNAAQLAALAKG